MPAWLDVIINILIVVVMLGVLIAVHEAGHLATAKMFKVYCFEYSVGMGPKIFSKKRKNGETAFSLRAIPFGGYVSMYGEPGAVPEGMEEPPAERSLNNIAKWKKCIVLVAGVTLNFFLGVTLIYIGDSACPVYYYAHSGVAIDGTTHSTCLDASYSTEIKSYISANAPKPAGGDTFEPEDYYVSLGLYETEQFSVRILACDVSIYASPEAATPLTPDKYVAVYAPATVVDAHQIGDSIYLFPTAEKEVPSALKEVGITALPDVMDAEGKSKEYNFSSSADGVTVNMPITFVPNGRHKGVEDFKAYAFRASGNLFRLGVKSGALQGMGVNINVIKAWNSFGDTWKQWASDVGSATTAIGRGLASLFAPGGWKNLSGVVGITAAMPQIKAAGGARMVLFYAGMISINLALFNLLPFPGLDGWQILVTAVEGATKKKMPAKAQTIVTIVGLTLLIGLMLFITVKDVVMLFI